jgi:cysteine desulfurase
MAPIHLDHNATTPLVPAAREAMLAALSADVGNPSSAHHAGRKARRLLEDAREQVAALLDAAPDEVIFTSGATEANNLAIFGLADEPPAHLLASMLEHPCVVEPLRQLAARGFDVEWLPVTPRGQVEPSAVVERLRDDTRLVCLMLANHETGAVQPVRAVASAIPAPTALHCDAAQAVGKMPVSFRTIGATTLSLSAHKFGGPVGIGALLVRRATRLRPLCYGGHQQRGLRPGTEPVALACGLAAALEYAVTNLDTNRTRLEALRTRLLTRLTAAVSPLVVNGGPDGLTTTLNVSFPGCRADLLLVALDLAGVAASTGSACSSGSLLPSPVLKAMGVPDDVLRSAMRFSLAPTLSESEIDTAAERIARCVRNARESG